MNKIKYFTSDLSPNDYFIKRKYLYYKFIQKTNEYTWIVSKLKSSMNNIKIRRYIFVR